MRYFMLLCGLCALCGCTPFIDAYHEAGQVATKGSSKPDRPAICYNPLFDSYQSVMPLAQAECEKQKKQAVFEEKDYFSCCLFYPMTAYYKCQSVVKK